MSSNTFEQSDTHLTAPFDTNTDEHTRAAEKAAAEQSDDQASEEEPTPTSDVERPDDSDAEESKPKPKPKKKGKGKGKGGIVIPEDWPWEEAKKVFMQPDVLPADEVEVSFDFAHRFSC